MSNTSTIFPPPPSVHKLSAKWNLNTAKDLDNKDMDIRKILVDNCIKDIMKEEDQKFVDTVTQMVITREQIIADHCQLCTKLPKLQINDNIMHALFNSEDSDIIKRVYNIECDFCAVKDMNIVIKVCVYGKHCEMGKAKLTALFATVEKLK